MPQTQSKSDGRGVNVILMTCIIGAVIYAIYASVTQTGIAGYATKLQMDLWGSASETTTMMLTMAALVIAAFVVVGVVTQIFPSTVAIKESATQQMNRPLGSLSWTWVFLISVAPVLIGGVVSALWYQSQRADAQAQVYSIDLTSAPAAPPKDARFVEVTGALARSRAAFYKKTEDQKVTHEVFAPLVASENSAEPIRFVVHDVAPETYDGKVNWPDVFYQKGAAQFSGRVGRALPPYVVSSLRSKGVTLDRSYTVIEWKDLRYRRPGEAAADNPWFIPLAVGGMLSVCLFPMMLVVRFKLARLQRRQRATGLYA